MATKNFIHRAEQNEQCITLIGMAGSGKTTIGCALAKHLDYAFLDTDHLIESIYGVSLQTIADTLSGPEFLDLEATVICSLRTSRTIIATGGSVVYRDHAMQALKELGPIVCLDAPLETIQARIALNPNRGLVIAPGQTIADLYAERYALYNKYATLHCDSTLPLQQCVRTLAHDLKAFLSV